MSDFLVSFGNKCSGNNLLELLKMPYGKCVPEGRCFDFSWGNMAILEERLADNNNILEKDGVVFAWVGDLVTDVSEEFVDALITRIGQIKNCRADGKISLESDEIFKKLNGAFAIIVADKRSFSIITDHGNFVQVYVGIESVGSLVSFGTHSDLVSTFTGESLQIDVISVGEFLNAGAPSFPYTMYENVKELNPARLYSVEAGEPSPRVRSVSYWMPPAEIRGDYKVDQLAKELEGAFLGSVRDRCLGEKVGIALSGGQDSRLIMAAVPKSVECIGLTFCDYINQEARIAKRVCECYGRDWVPVFRDKDCLGSSILPAVQATGCEFEWVQAHALGLVDDISKLDLKTILGGSGMDVYLKGCFANDWVCKKRMKGLLRDRYERKPYEHVNNISRFEKEIVDESIIDAIYLRRQHAYNENLDLSRSSIGEWLTQYPFSLDSISEATSIGREKSASDQRNLDKQVLNFACVNPQGLDEVQNTRGVTGVTGWATERRFLPMRLVALDKRILDFNYKCPLELKLGGKVFLQAAKNIYGPGGKLPSASDGVRPGSGHWSRLFQRAIRKSQSRTTKILEKLGKEPRVQGSWHDYQKYWRESEKLDELRQQYGANLNQFDGILFKDSGPELLENKDLDWHYGFRLLQLAVWLGIIEEYRNVLKGRSS